MWFLLLLLLRLLLLLLLLLLAGIGNESDEQFSFESTDGSDFSDCERVSNSIVNDRPQDINSRSIQRHCRTAN